MSDEREIPQHLRGAYKVRVIPCVEGPHNEEWKISKKKLSRRVEEKDEDDEMKYVDIIYIYRNVRDCAFPNYYFYRDVGQGFKEKLRFYPFQAEKGGIVASGEVCINEEEGYHDLWDNIETFTCRLS